MKSFLEMWKIIEAVELDTNKPVPLSKITPQIAQAAIVGGKKDNNEKDDKALGAEPEDSVAVASLLPMQKEVIPMKSLGMALQYLLGRFDKLTDMEAIVSQDNYIMDGHHRWAAATLINPGMEVKVARIGLPAAQLVTALNIWTKSKGRDGNQGKGDISQFASSIPPLLDKIMNEGIPDQTDKEGNLIKGLSVEEVKQALASPKLGNGDPVAGANLMKENATKLPTAKHPDAPERVDMPVVNGKAEIKDVIDKLMAGEIDWNKPLSKDTMVASGLTLQNVGGTTGGPGTGQQNIGATTTQQNIAQSQAPRVTGQQSQSRSFQMNFGPNTTNSQPKKLPFPAQQPPQQRQVASTQYNQPSLNECLILAGIKKK